MQYTTYRATLLVAALITLASLSFATPIVIDDFKVGTFDVSLVGGTTNWVVQSGLSATHVLGGQRDHNLTIASNAFAPDAMAKAFVNTNLEGVGTLNNDSGVAGYLMLRWATAPLDIMAAGPALEMRHRPDLAGGTYQIVLTSASGTSSFTHTTVLAESGHYNILNIPWASFSGTADLHNITGVRLNINQASLLDDFDSRVDYIRTENVVPEPGTYLLFGAGLGLLGLWRRRRA